MTSTDYLTDLILILLVVRQVRTARFDRRAWLLPLVIVGVLGKSYLHGIPTSGNSLLVVAGLSAVGVVLGSLSGLTTRVWSDGGRYALVKGGTIAAALWVIGMGGRMLFAIWASHGGDATIGRFSLEHGIDPSQTWTAALVLMAVGQVASRVGILALRADRAQSDAASRSHAAIYA